MPQLNVILLRGLFGDTFSRGMDVLAMRLKKVPGIDFVAVDSYTNWEEWARASSKWKDPTIPVGHSFGANAAVMLAQYLVGNGKRVPLLVSFDPSPHPSIQLGRSGPPPVPANVARVINFYQSQSFLIPGALLLREDGSKRGIDNQMVKLDHEDVDDDPELQAKAVTEIGAVAASPALVA